MSVTGLARRTFGEGTGQQEVSGRPPPGRVLGASPSGPLPASLQHPAPRLCATASPASPQSPATRFWPLEPERHGWQLSLLVMACHPHAPGRRSPHCPSPRACATSQVPGGLCSLCPAGAQGSGSPRKNRGSSHSPQSTRLLAQPRPRAQSQKQLRLPAPAPRAELPFSRLGPGRPPSQGQERC